MPQSVAIEAVPTYSRSQESKYAEVCKFVTELVSDVKNREKSGLLFTHEDGVHLSDSAPGVEPAIKSNVGQVMQTIRLAAKQVGAKVALVMREGEGLYVKYNGEFVAMTPEQIAQRKAAAKANRANQAIAASQAAKAAK